jgi:hypothetical protein
LVYNWYLYNLEYNCMITLKRHRDCLDSLDANLRERFTGEDDDKVLLFRPIIEL